MVNLKEHRDIHCIGIGGVGLSAIAEILISRGYNVSGSDMNESEITERLKESGATIYNNHRKENVEKADLIIYSAAIAEENPEIVRARERKLPLASRAEVLGVLMDEYKGSIAISGTHGKTTTTSMVSLVLEAAELDPTILVGGQLAEIGGNVKVGKSDYFVTEACEYRDSFLELRPNIEVILNIDSDHLDYFKDIDHIVSSFEKFAMNVPSHGKIIAYDSNPFVSEVIKGRSNVVTYGYNENSDFVIKDVRFDEEGMPSFSVEHKGIETKVHLSVPGEHNILNSVAAFACCVTMGVDRNTTGETLGKYRGTQRRFDIVGITKNGVKIVDDYAHHPTEIKATISAAHNIPHKKLWILFQPHTYTRTLALFHQFADAFSKSDVLVLADIYAAREKDIYNISSKKLAEEIKKHHADKDVHYMDSFEKIRDYVMANAEKGDLVITMGAGDIYKVGTMIMDEEA
ncbi:MAG: UDP-N-acetylmuramate--L-alanine ligase [Hornefia sp.]|nr:UDP-N-acetylmuramate--L-alanine ligase [Hornefia sp.]